MRSLRYLLTALLIVVATAVASPADAAVEAGEKCEAAKLKAAGKGCLCRHKALAKAALKGTTADLTRCFDRVGDAFSKSEEKAAGACPSEADAAVVDGRLAALGDDVDAALDEGGTTKDHLKCRAAKLKALGKKCLCLHKAKATAVTRGDFADYSRCEERFAAAVAKAEAKAPADCPTTATVEDLCNLADATFAQVEADLANLGTADFAERGPYKIGFTTLTLVDTSRPTQANGTYPGAADRTLTVEVWYPTLIEGSFFERRDAAFPDGHGPFPVIVRAHGFSGLRRDSTAQTRQLASYGYIVVSPDFPLSHLAAPGGATLTDVDEQALDVGFLLDSVEALNADPDGLFFGRVDTDSIGTLGHSLGGATVLVATYHETHRDPRIDATATVAPLACVVTDIFFDNATVPLLIVGGTTDLITGYLSNHSGAYSIANTPKYLVELVGGSHMGYIDDLGINPLEHPDEFACPIFVGDGPRPVVLDPGLPPDYLGGEAMGIDPSGSMCEAVCPEPPPSWMDIDRQRSLTLATIAAYFEATLRGSESARRLITGRLDADNADVNTFSEE